MWVCETAEHLPLWEPGGGGAAAKEAARIQKWEEQDRNDLSGLCGAEIALVRWVYSNLINLNPNPCFFLISVPYLASPMLLPLLGTVHTLASSSSHHIKAVTSAQSRRARETVTGPNSRALISRAKAGI